MFRRIQLSAALAAGGLLLLSAVAAEPPAAGKQDVRKGGQAYSRSAPATSHQNYTETLDGPEGKITFEMVAVPSGQFLMGSSNAEEDRREDEGPQVKVGLKAFWIGKCEVSWDEFDLYFKIGNTNLEKVAEGAERQPEKPKPGAKLPGAPGPADAVSKPTSPYVDETYGFPREKHPAICMTHHAAMKYCEWLSKKTGKDYRLPTEAEWEYACRAGTTTPYAVPEGHKLTDYAWYKQNARNEEGRLSPHATGTRQPNGWGIHDMHGNVMEWVMDHYVKDAHGRFAKQLMGGFVANPTFAPTENKWAHVARGGHFKDDAKDLRSAARRKSEKKWMAADPQEPQSIWWLTNYPIIGFRVCRPVEPDDLTGITSKVVKENDEEFKP